VTAREARLLRPEAADEWLLLSAPGAPIRINGWPIGHLALHALRHRDEVVIDDQLQLFFSAEDPAMVETYAGPAEASCPRCFQPLVSGQQVVRISCCGVFLHESDSKRCFSYDAFCPGHRHPLPSLGNFLFDPRAQVSDE
jgi:hypothetical protein